MQDKFFGDHLVPGNNPAFLQTLADDPGLLSQKTFDGILERSTSADNKERMVVEIEQLVQNHDAFGFPWIICHRKQDGKTESFFGSDRMSNIAWWFVVVTCVAASISQKLTSWLSSTGLVKGASMLVHTQNAGSRQLYS